MAKRAASYSGSEDESDRPVKKKAATKKKPAAPRLKKSKGNNWKDLNPQWSSEKPTGEHAKACVERWCLLAPFDPSVTEEQWKAYYHERAALDKIQTVGSEESKEIVSEELAQDTYKILSDASAELAAIVKGTVIENEGEKLALSRTINGSLYMVKLWGNDEGDGSPRTVNAQTRLYSPYGLGTSIDLKYDFTFRDGRANEKYSTLAVSARGASNCSSSNPTECSAIIKTEGKPTKPSPDAVKLFDMKGAKSTGTTQAKLLDFEPVLFGTDGWISPKKLYELLATAATAQCYNESIDSGREKGATKFKSYFQGETEVAAEKVTEKFVDGDVVSEKLLAAAKSAPVSAPAVAEGGEAVPVATEAPMEGVEESAAAAPVEQDNPVGAERPAEQSEAVEALKVETAPVTQESAPAEVAVEEPVAATEAPAVEHKTEDAKAAANEAMIVDSTEAAAPSAEAPAAEKEEPTQ